MFYLLQRILASVCRILLKCESDVRLRQVKSRTNVQIHPSFSAGTGTEFLIRGTCKELAIRENVVCQRGCNFLVYPDATLTIGKNVFFNNYCSVNSLEKITIGDNTLFGEGVKIYDHNHQYERHPQLVIQKDKFTTSPVSIGKDCWIASNVTILKGVTIGDNVIIGANCLIYESVASNSIVKIKQEHSIQ